MTVTAIKLKEGQFGTSLLLTIDGFYEVFLSGYLAEIFQLKFERFGWIKFKYNGKKKSTSGYEYHDVEFL